MTGKHAIYHNCFHCSLPLCMWRTSRRHSQLLELMAACLCFNLDLSMQKGSSSASTSKVDNAPAQMQMCCVCFLSFATNAVNVRLPCGHNDTCPACWRRYIMSKLDDGQAAHLQCTQPGCRMAVPLAEAKRVLPATWCGAR